MYRAGLEWILVFRVQGTTLLIDPCIPSLWPGFEIVFRYRSGRYNIKVENPGGVNRGIVSAELDGRALPDNQARIPLTDDGQVYYVRIVLG
jgi:cyclic beta-1,2-glucan synthetase